MPFQFRLEGWVSSPVKEYDKESSEQRNSMHKGSETRENLELQREEEEQRSWRR